MVMYFVCVVSCALFEVCQHPFVYGSVVNDFIDKSVFKFLRSWVTLKIQDTETDQSI